MANLQMGNALPTYSEYGYGYAVEKAPTTKGWSHPSFRALELWLSQEMRHFARAIRDRKPRCSQGKTANCAEAHLCRHASAAWA